MPRRKSHPAVRVTLCLLLCAGILGVFWKAHGLLGLPRPFSFSIQRNPASQDTSRDSRELTVSAHTIYALQLGAFAQQEAAAQTAREYAARGAAGYIMNDAGTYRVLAAAYPSRAEAQAVQTRLNGQGISTYIHPGTQEAFALRVGGTASQVRALQETLAYLDALGGKLHTLSNTLDAGEAELADTQAALSSECVTCRQFSQRLADAFGGTLPEALTSLGDTLLSIADCLPREASAARTGAALKHAELTVFYGLCAFRQAAEGA